MQNLFFSLKLRQHLMNIVSQLFLKSTRNITFVNQTSCCKIGGVFSRNYISCKAYKFCAYSFCTMPTPKGVRENWTFNISSNDLLSKTNKVIEETRKVYDSVAAVPDESVSYETVLKVLGDMECNYSSSSFFIECIQHFSPDSALRDASTESEKLLKVFILESDMRQDVFKKLQLLKSKSPSLKPEAKRYLEKLILKGKRNGLHLSDEIQNEIKALQKKIDGIAIEFSKNLNEVDTTFDFSDKELDGLPEDFILNLKKNPENGKYIVSLKYPDFFPIMRKCKVPETRRKMELAFNSQCEKENHPLLDEVIKLRHEIANLLGYPNHASFVTEILMSKTADNVRNFLNELKQKLIPLWVEEKKFLLELKEKECKELGIEFDGKLNPYDLFYYTNKVKEVKYNVDETKLKEYFPMNAVVEQVLNIYQKLLGVVFTEVKDPEVWHSDVKMFAVKDASTSQILGYFYLDLFPRQGKYSHAAAFEMQPGCLLPDGSRQLAICAMVCNFSQSTTDKPTLMDHDEVTTFFHEFGHVMHFICAQADYVLFSGFNVERDFVEAPSQMLENWCWQPESLKLLSSHYIDKSVIPDSLLNNLIKSKLANAGYVNLRQIILASYDFTLHSSDKCDVRQTYCDLMEEIIGVNPSEGTHFGCNFRHIVNGYDAQYYSYLWSEVFSFDMFETCFKKGNNILNPEVGMQYRKKILHPGGTKDASDLLVDFLGRHPTQDAFLRSKGLKV